MITMLNYYKSNLRPFGMNDDALNSVTSGEVFVKAGEAVTSNDNAGV